MKKKFEHTEGPWHASDYGEIQANNGDILGFFKRTEDAQRIEQCHNGCDAAGVVEPEGLADLMRAGDKAEAVLARLTRDSVQHEAWFELITVLRAVRGE